jgi:phosphotriesterase-related protein
MKEVMTVLGPISSAELGFTSMHEHILIPQELKGMSDDPVSLDNIGLLRRMFMLCKDNCRLDDEDVMAAEVADFKTSGGSAMVEMSALGLRLDLEGIKRISEKTGVHIIATTGLYIEESWPETYRNMTQEQLRAHMVKEIDRGIDDTGIRAGHIKTALMDLTEGSERLLRAAARASIETGLSVTVHPGFGIGNDGRRIIKMWGEEGMDLSRAILAHSEGFFVEHCMKTLILDPASWKLNLDYAKEVLDHGANISIDCFAHARDAELRKATYETDWQRLAGLVALIKAGYSSQIVLGTDVCLKINARRYGGDGYCRLLRFVVPTLRELGASDYDIRQMTVVNPARLLAR